MSAIIARLILSTALMFAVPALYIASLFVFQNSMNRYPDRIRMFLLADVLCGLFLIACWLLIWRAEIR